MPSLFARLILFLSSYVPLMMLVAILYWGNWRAVGVLLSLALVSVLLLRWFMRSAAEFTPVPMVVADVRQRDSESLSYIVTYLVPFLAVDKTKPEQVAAMVGLFALIGLIYVRTPMIFVNPTLTLMKYNLVEVVSEKGDAMLALTRLTVRPGETAMVSKVGDKILLVHETQPA